MSKKFSKISPELILVTVFVTNTDDYNEMSYNSEFELEYVSVLVSKCKFQEHYDSYTVNYEKFGHHFFSFILVFFKNMVDFKKF